MKTLQLTVLLSLLFGCASAQAGNPVINVTVGGEISPGVYGEVQFGNAPPPPVVYAQPVIITHESHSEEGRPLYLHVPPGHAKNWKRHCREYNACNRPVYFVRSAEYEPGYREHRGEKRREEERRDEGRRDEGRRDERRDEERGNEGRRGEGRRD